MALPELPPADQLLGHLAATHGHASSEAVARASSVLRQVLACGVKSNLLAVLEAQRAIGVEHAEALRTEARKTARVVPYEPPLHALRLSAEEDKRVAQMAVQNHLIPAAAHADAVAVQQKVRGLGLPVLLCDVLCDRAHLPAPAAAAVGGGGEVAFDLHRRSSLLRATGHREPGRHAAPDRLRARPPEARRA
ncbi:MAG: hypothetical protein HYY93_00090 [Planctomycetes bacterium]|nr:hypothetical protein [Planctomycetota bacterium]